LVTGEDLKKMGYGPGPLYKEIFRAVEDAQLDGTLGDRERALAFVREKFPI
jgi:hypothetical protein